MPWHADEHTVCKIALAVLQLPLWATDLPSLFCLPLQLQNGGPCPHSSMYSPSLPAPDPAQWINILNSNENLLKEKELLIDR